MPLVNLQYSPSPSKAPSSVMVAFSPGEMRAQRLRLSNWELG